LGCSLIAVLVIPAGFSFSSLFIGIWAAADQLIDNVELDENLSVPSS